MADDAVVFEIQGDADGRRIPWMGLFNEFVWCTTLSALLLTPAAPPHVECCLSCGASSDRSPNRVVALCSKLAFADWWATTAGSRWPTRYTCPPTPPRWHNAGEGIDHLHDPERVEHRPHRGQVPEPPVDPVGGAEKAGRAPRGPISTATRITSSPPTWPRAHNNSTRAHADCRMFEVNRVPGSLPCGSCPAISLVVPGLAASVRWLSRSRSRGRRRGGFLAHRRSAARRLRCFPSPW
jgi:hypothetical protein